MQLQGLTTARRRRFLFACLKICIPRFEEKLSSSVYFSIRAHTDWYRGIHPFPALRGSGGLLGGDSFLRPSFELNEGSARGRRGPWASRPKWIPWGVTTSPGRFAESIQYCLRPLQQLHESLYQGAPIRANGTTFIHITWLCFVWKPSLLILTWLYLNYNDRRLSWHYASQTAQVTYALTQNHLSSVGEANL